jgi:hypothetical protein
MARFAALVGAVDVNEGDVEGQGGHGDQLLAVVIGRAHRAQPGVPGEDVGAEAGARRQERHALRRGAQAELEHALVELDGLDLAALAGGAEARLEGPRCRERRSRR